MEAKELTCVLTCHWNPRVRRWEQFGGGGKKVNYNKGKNSDFFPNNYSNKNSVKPRDLWTKYLKLLESLILPLKEGIESASFISIANI